MILKALKFAETKHAGQTRKVSKQPYVSHPIKVSYLLASFKQSKKIEELICAALLHDTLEDTDTSFEEIAKNFTPLVASLVWELTSDEEEIKKLGKNTYLKNKMKNMSSYALTLKLVDRLANITDSPKESYKTDTLELLDWLKDNRNMSKTQLKIIETITKEIKP